MLLRVVEENAQCVSHHHRIGRAQCRLPDLNVKITESYATQVARDTFMWAWPLVNIYNKRRGAEQSKELAYAGAARGLARLERALKFPE